MFTIFHDTKVPQAVERRKTWFTVGLLNTGWIHYLYVFVLIVQFLIYKGLPISNEIMIIYALIMVFIAIWFLKSLPDKRKLIDEIIIEDDVYKFIFMNKIKGQCVLNKEEFLVNIGPEKITFCDRKSNDVWGFAIKKRITESSNWDKLILFLGETN